jgi:lactate dehydrogenase-like 2-hydroxyacid dehydrogenase
MAKLGPQGVLVNVARGSVVDEPALIAALRSGALGHAALDVYWNEPNPDPALTALPNVTLYPHHASGTEETRDAMAQLVVDNLAACFAGQPLLTPVYDLPGSR